MKLRFVRLGLPISNAAYKRDERGTRYAWLDLYRWRVCLIWRNAW